jgi:hypothetical protein
MLNLPLLSRIFSVILLALGLYLALENTLISAQVLQQASGATMVTAFSIAVVATGLELAFASWIRQEKTFPELMKELQNKPVHTSMRLFAAGLGLAIVYHFDLLTTASHPSFAASDNYFFSVVVIALVFGPEVCIVIASWLWLSSRDVQIRHLEKNTAKDAENQRLKTKRQKLVAIAEEVGQAEAISTARARWGAGTDSPLQ